MLPLPLPPHRSSPSSSFVSSLQAALRSFAGAEPLMAGLECGRCTLVETLRAAREEAAEAERRGRAPPRWRRRNMRSSAEGGGDAARGEFSELLQLAFPSGSGAGGSGSPAPFPLDVEALAERARRAGLPWDRTVSLGAGGGGRAGAGGKGALLRETAVRRSTLARCPRVLCLQLLRALGPEAKLRGSVDFGFVMDVGEFTAAGAEPLLPSWRRARGGDEGEGEREGEGEEERRRKQWAPPPPPPPPVSDAAAEAAGAAPLRQFIVPLSAPAPPPRPRQLPPERSERRGPIYLISAVVAHTGSGTSRGHYICYRRVSSSSSSSSPLGDGGGGGGAPAADASPPPPSSYWCGCSDLRVWRASDEEVRRCEAVMLVYVRQ